MKNYNQKRCMKPRAQTERNVSDSTQMEGEDSNCIWNAQAKTLALDSRMFLIFDKTTNT